MKDKKSHCLANLAIKLCNFKMTIDQFRYIKIQPKTIDLSTRFWGKNPTNSVFIPQSLALNFKSHYLSSELLSKTDVVHQEYISTKYIAI